jgi:hypothetical protein
MVSIGALNHYQNKITIILPFGSKLKAVKILPTPLIGKNTNAKNKDLTQNGYRQIPMVHVQKARDRSVVFGLLLYPLHVS